MRVATITLPTAPINDPSPELIPPKTPATNSPSNSRIPKFISPTRLVQVLIAPCSLSCKLYAKISSIVLQKLKLDLGAIERSLWFRRDNVRDHRAGTIISLLKSTRKSGFACITLLSGACTIRVYASSKNSQNCENVEAISNHSHDLC